MLAKEAGRWIFKTYTVGMQFVILAISVALSAAVAEQRVGGCHGGE